MSGKNTTGAGKAPSPRAIASQEEAQGLLNALREATLANPLEFGMSDNRVSTAKSAANVVNPNSVIPKGAQIPVNNFAENKAKSAPPENTIPKNPPEAKPDTVVQPKPAIQPKAADIVVQPKPTIQPKNANIVVKEVKSPKVKVSPTSQEISKGDVPSSPTANPKLIGEWEKMQLRAADYEKLRKENRMLKQRLGKGNGKGTKNALTKSGIIPPDNSPIISPKPTPPKTIASKTISSNTVFPNTMSSKTMSSNTIFPSSSFSPNTTVNNKNNLNATSGGGNLGNIADNTGNLNNNTNSLANNSSASSNLNPNSPVFIPNSLANNSAASSSSDPNGGNNPLLGDPTVGNNPTTVGNNPTTQVSVGKNPPTVSDSESELADGKDAKTIEASTVHGTTDAVQALKDRKQRHLATKILLANSRAENEKIRARQAEVEKNLKNQYENEVQLRITEALEVERQLKAHQKKMRIEERKDQIISKLKKKKEYRKAREERIAKRREELQKEAVLKKENAEENRKKQELADAERADAENELKKKLKEEKEIILKDLEEKKLEKEKKREQKETQRLKEEKKKNLKRKYEKARQTNAAKMRKLEEEKANMELELEREIQQEEDTMSLDSGLQGEDSPVAGNGENTVLSPEIQEYVKKYSQEDSQNESEPEEVLNAEQTREALKLWKENKISVQQREIKRREEEKDKRILDLQAEVRREKLRAILRTNQVDGQFAMDNNAEIESYLAEENDAEIRTYLQGKLKRPENELNKSFPKIQRALDKPPTCSIPQLQSLEQADSIIAWNQSIESVTKSNGFSESWKTLSNIPEPGEHEIERAVRVKLERDLQHAIEISPRATQFAESLLQAILESLTNVKLNNQLSQAIHTKEIPNTPSGVYHYVMSRSKGLDICRHEKALADYETYYWKKSKASILMWYSELLIKASKMSKTRRDLSYETNRRFIYRCVNVNAHERVRALIISFQNFAFNDPEGSLGGSHSNEALVRGLQKIYTQESRNTSPETQCKIYAAYVTEESSSSSASAMLVGTTGKSDAQLQKKKKQNAIKKEKSKKQKDNARAFETYCANALPVVNQNIPQNQAIPQNPAMTLVVPPNMGGPNATGMPTQFIPTAVQANYAGGQFQQGNANTTTRQCDWCLNWYISQGTQHLNTKAIYSHFSNQCSFAPNAKNKPSKGGGGGGGKGNQTKGGGKNVKKDWKKQKKGNNNNTKGNNTGNTKGNNNTKGGAPFKGGANFKGKGKGKKGGG